MKKLIVLISDFFLISLMGVTQIIAPEKVPADVGQAFAKKCPGATDIKYEMDKKDYEVSYKENGVVMSANFNSDGEWLETETIISESDLPERVLNSAAESFVDFKITQVSKVESKDKVVYYEMYLKTNKKGYDVKFSPEGVVLKKTKLK